jgi:hypothetical protein
MDTSTRASRIAVARRLSTALHRAPGDVRPDAGDTLGPPHCGLSEDEPCDMKNPERCAIHGSVPDDDPELLGLSGTLASRKQQLKLARRRGLRL